MALNEHQITLAEAAQLTKNFRTLPVGQASALLGTKACALPNDAIQAVLDQPGCESIRVYFGIKLGVPPQLTIVVVGVDVNGNDITEGIILDEAKACPPSCSDNNVLNS